MYIEIVDETGLVFRRNHQTDPRYLGCPKRRARKKEMAVTFVTNERSHELNLNTEIRTDQQMLSA